MSDIKPRGAAITIEGVEHHWIFTLNAIDDLQDMYEDENIFEILREAVGNDGDLDVLRNIVMVLMNDEAEREKRVNGKDLPKVTARDVGSILGRDNFGDIMLAVTQAYGLSMPDPDEDEENPNPESGQNS